MNARRHDISRELWLPACLRYHALICACLLGGFAQGHLRCAVLVVRYVINDKIFVRIPSLWLANKNFSNTSNVNIVCCKLRVGSQNTTD